MRRMEIFGPHGVVKPPGPGVFRGARFIIFASHSTSENLRVLIKSGGGKVVTNASEADHAVVGADHLDESVKEKIQRSAEDNPA
eukprot:CAMPEP_0113905326 /NCGR_PEP_ID=MMETSP0780_2-20120614/23924_1 /TAXON_ID=652834 /ORGANISM="Palpitomonas bilix" /LENGTH=83 /DNA_ID=CAMNT_0000899391 /DNA_START=51 /DNA_END=299 /DNA_ORIENTATION=- /assembly_acc=CAM_ASM_000599